MKIILIEAGLPSSGLSWTSWMDARGRFAMPSTGLLSLASLVGDDDEIEIIDEKVAGPVVAIEADLVGISFKAMNAHRAYEVADSLRAIGIQVALGGIHASLVPGEAAEHADAVVIGEGEAVWPMLLNDVKSGRLAPVYTAPTPPSPISNLPRQRVELIRHNRYLLHAVQSARGCSFDCEFCPTRAIFGEGYRLRDVDAVASEVERLLAIEEKPVFFTESVFGAGNVQFISKLTRRLSELSVPYAVICDYQMLKPEIVDMLAAGGCRLVALNLTGTGNPEEIKAVEAVRSAGLALWGYFMFGFESDTADVFQGAVDIAREYGLACVSLTVLSPYPGTPMAMRLEQENRILNRDISLYDQSQVLFKPARMTAGQLQEGFAYACRELGELGHFERVVASLYNSRRDP